MSAGGSQLWRNSGAASHLPQGVIYPELIHSGINETLVQNTNAFNAATRNAIRMWPQASRGDLHHTSFFKNVPNLIQRRVVTSTSPENQPVTPNNVPMDENISVKLNRRIGPVDQTFDSFRKLTGGGAPRMDVLSFAIGEQVAKAMEVEMLDTGLRSCVAALNNNFAGNTLIDLGPGASPQRTATTNDLIDLLALIGDAANRLVMWVMHSKVYYDIVKDQVALTLTGVSDFNIATATPITLNRPVLVTDSDALVTAATSFSPNTQGAQYATLGLTEEAIQLMESEGTWVYSDVITGNENIVARTQGEYAYNVGVKGYRWDPANGGINPDNTALTTGTNWDAVRDSSKDHAGVLLYSQ